MAKDNRTFVYFDRDKLVFVGLEDAQIKQLKETYKGIDVDVELKKMGLWLLSQKGSKRRGNIGFILNWLNNSRPQGTPPSTTEQFNLYEVDSPLRPLLQEYLKDLWKGREHILEFNKIRKKN